MVILATFGSGGDLEPFVVMARGLQSRGHPVCIVAPIYHQARLRETGLPHHNFGTVALIEGMLNDPDLWHERRGMTVIARGLSVVFDETIGLFTRLAADPHCVAICHPFMLPAAAIARAQRPGLRLIGAWLAPSSMRSIHDPLLVGRRRIAPWVPSAWRGAMWRFVDRWWIDNAMLPWLNAARKRQGLPQVEGFFAHLSECGDAALGLFPNWFAAPAPDWPAPFRQVNFPLPSAVRDELDPELEAFLAAGDPPIVFTFGTAMRHAGEAFKAAHRALATLGRRGLFITRHADQLPRELSTETRHVSWASFPSLLPRTAAIVHHGGIGTTAEALRAGIPQLVLASGLDQFDNGQRWRALGVGYMVPATRISARSLTSRLRRLLDSPETALACAALAARLDGVTHEKAFDRSVSEMVDAQRTTATQSRPYRNTSLVNMDKR